MSLTETVTKAIRDSLPALAANELSEFIDQAQKDKKALDEHKEVVRKLSLSTIEQAETIKGLENTLKTYKDLEKREKEVEKREQAMELTLCKGDLINAVKRAESIERLAEIAFKNPRLVHSEFGSIPVTTPSSGGYVSNHSTSKTITVEETK